MAHCGSFATQVAEQMLNPFGGDDDDVDLNGIIDGMLKVDRIVLYI